MDKTQIILLLLLVSLVILNIAATIFVLKAVSFDAKQKIIQIILLWTIPVFGAFVAIYFANGSDKSKPNYQTTDSVARHDIHYGGGSSV